MKKLISALLVALFVSACGQEQSEMSAADGDWRHHGGNHRSDKYSPLDQVNGSNFALLEVAWRYRSPDLDLPEELAYPTGDYRAVPLVIDGVM